MKAELRKKMLRDVLTDDFAIWSYVALALGICFIAVGPWSWIANTIVAVNRWWRLVDIAFGLAILWAPSTCLADRIAAVMQADRVVRRDSTSKPVDE